MFSAVGFTKESQKKIILQFVDMVMSLAPFYYSEVRWSLKRVLLILSDDGVSDI